MVVKGNGSMRGKDEDPNTILPFQFSNVKIPNTRPVAVFVFGGRDLLMNGSNVYAARGKGGSRFVG